jgi:hypothetical protein
VWFGQSLRLQGRCIRDGNVAVDTREDGGMPASHRVHSFTLPVNTQEPVMDKSGRSLRTSSRIDLMTQVEELNREFTRSGDRENQETQTQVGRPARMGCT